MYVVKNTVKMYSSNFTSKAAKVTKNSEQLAWKGDTEHETYYPTELDVNT